MFPISNKTVKNIAIVAASLAGAAGLYWGIIKPVINRSRNSKTNNYDESTKSGLANVLADQMYLAIKGIGTDEKAIYNAAQRMRNANLSFATVADAFYTKYKKNLSEWLTGDLSTNEYIKFQKILTGEETYTINGVASLNGLFSITKREEEVF